MKKTTKLKISNELNGLKADRDNLKIQNDTMLSANNKISQECGILKKQIEEIKSSDEEEIQKLTDRCNEVETENKKMEFKIQLQNISENEQIKKLINRCDELQNENNETKKSTQNLEKKHKKYCKTIKVLLKIKFSI